MHSLPPRGHDRQRLTAAPHEAWLQRLPSLDCIRVPEDIAIAEDGDYIYLQVPLEE